jgi:hypothetical protein
MAEVGKSTGKKTQAGREVYETPDGEMVSEKSTTFKYKGKWINVPTIHNGYAYDDDILRMMLDAEVIKPTSTHKSKEDAIKSAIERSKSLKFDKGGDVASQTEEALLNSQWDERKLGAGLTSLEFEADMMPLLKKDPIAMLGYKASRPNRRSPSIQKLPAAFPPLYYDVSEDPVSPNYNPSQDKVGYGRDYGSSKDVILHELRHRGLKILEERYKEKDSFIAEYGDMAYRLLDKANISGTKSNEFVVELYDNPDATYIKPGNNGSKNTIGYVSDSLQFVDPNSDTQVMPDVADELLGIALSSEDHNQYRSLVDNTSISKEEIEIGKSGLDKAARDLLTEIGVLGFEAEPNQKFSGGGLANYRTRLVDMTDEERAEVAPGSSAYGNFLGNTGDKKPLSVQMAETGLDLATPVGTIKDIQDELGKKDPSYALIAGMASLELLGPAAGAIKMAAKAGNKGVIQKILDSFKNKPAPGFEESALKTAANQNDLSREILVEMPIDDFLAAAKKEVSPEKLEKTRRLISEGTPFETIPSLQFKNNGDGTAKVIGHDGRHRAMALKEKGETTIPVRLQSSGGDGPSIRWGQQSDPNSSDYVDTLPRQLVEEDGEALINMPDTGIKRKEDLGFNEDVYHYTTSETIEGDKFNPDKAIGNWNRLGVHVGGQKASRDRFTGINDPKRYPDNVQGSTLPLKARTDKPLMFSDEVESEYSVQSNLRKMAEARGLDPTDYAADLRKQLAEEGYTHIPYINEVEAEGTISYIMLVDRPEGSNAVIRSKFAEFDPSEKDKPELGLAQGGGVGNMSMKKQMSLFEYGGIADDGMNKDPVSGNNVPPGSLAKEVRDDIPAMLSEGEYVVPADVLRYYGVNFFENLRGQAKQGLNTMEQNGRIGGTPMTQQDVARNMQQPMMTPPPVQAAQGAMMQSPMRIKQQPAPQAVGNSGIPTQGYAGEDGSIVSKWSPARARYSSPMFQGTSSQQANIQTAQDQAATESITYMRTHYNQNGESVLIAYEGTDPVSATPKAGQDQLLSNYPLTEEEYNAYKSEVTKSEGDGGSGSGGSGGGGGTTVSAGSDTSWMDGINFDDSASVKKWVESADGLGMSGDARRLANKGVLGLVPQGIQANDIAKVRGIRGYYDSIGDNEMVKYLDGELKKAEDEGGLLFSALDKLGLLTGDSYSKQIASSIPDLRKKFTSTRDDTKFEESGASVYKPGGIDVAMLDTSDDGPGLTAAQQSAVDKSRARASASKAAVQAAFDDSASTNTAEEIQDFKEKVEEAGGTWNVGGRAEGGLMTAPQPKKKKKSKPRNTGLAGKK